MKTDCFDCKHPLPLSDNLWDHVASDPVVCPECGTTYTIFWEEFWDGEEEWGYFEKERVSAE